MKVLMINGSRRDKGCTYTALNLIAESLKEEGIDSHILFVGRRAANGEINELVKEAGKLVEEADGFVFGSPVYYASASGEIIAFLDRLYWDYSKQLRFKPAATIASARRAGTTATLDILNKYPLINQMPLVASCYWNMVHGYTPEEVMQDEEGVYVMKMLGKNMAWMLKSIEAGKAAGITQPVDHDRPATNYIR